MSRGVDHHLELNGREYRVRMEIPRELRPAFGGKRMLRKSLGTSDLHKARQLRDLEVLPQFKLLLTQARNPGDPVIERARALRRQLEDCADDTDAEQKLSHAAFDVAVKAGLDPVWLRDDGSLPDPAKDIPALDTADRFYAVASGRVTPLDFYLEEWITVRDRPLRPSTAAQYRKAFRTLVAWLKSRGIEPNVEAITRGRALQFRDECLRTRLKAAETINAHLTALRSHWRWLLDRERVMANPWERTSIRDRWRTEHQQPRPFADDEVRKLLSGHAPHPLPDLMMVAALTGARIDAICNLRVRDCKDGSFAFEPRKREKRSRQVPIHPDLRRIVARRIANKGLNDFLFHECPDATAKRPRSAAAVQAFTRYRRKVGVDEVRDGQRVSNVNFHSFRRWFQASAQRALERGATGFTPWTIADVVGHAREQMPLAMTMGRYAGPSDSEARRACVEAVKLPRLPAHSRQAFTDRPPPVRRKRAVRKRAQVA